jgi:chorismate-pyruvate lyase
MNLEILSPHSSLSLFQRILLLTDGSVTGLLSIYTGQEIRARKLEQFVSREPGDPRLECREGALLLHRKIMLVDCRSRRHVYAASSFIMERLSQRTLTLLLETDAPIGLVWKEEKAEMYRDVVDIRREHCRVTTGYFGLPPETALLSRTYLLLQGGSPLGVITEKFPASSFIRIPGEVVPEDGGDRHAVSDHR